MTQTIEDRKKAFVSEAFEALFNKKDYAGAERFWSPSCIQHSKHIRPGRDGLFGLVKVSLEKMRYENGAILAEGNLLMLRGRFSRPRPAGELDCRQYLGRALGRRRRRGPRETSVSGFPMFRTAFPTV
jgi:predicted SnoaL-like aldol condensation-catalyzing enzyme